MSGLPRISLLGEDATARTGESETEPLAGHAAETPPLPSRNERRKAPLAVAAGSGAQAPSRQVGLSLPSLSASSLFKPSAYAPDTSQWEASPVAVYTQLAQQIRACWFTPGAPKLTNHGFHAEVEPDGTGDTKIIIYQKAEDGKRGLQAFRILIGSGLGGSTVKAENRRLDAKLDLSFKADLVRWSKGDQSCQS